MNSLLELKDVSYWYTHAGVQHTILNSINIKFNKGTFYTIVGSSGSGKTTLLSLLSALDVPKEGEVIYDGTTLKKIGLTKFRNKFVSIVFQSYNLLPYMTALQNVVTAMEITSTPQKNKKAIALGVLQKVGIDEVKARQKVLTLSGGQQQRVSIARALSCQSDLIVADEPTGNLDEDTAKEIVQIFQDIAHTENKCVIMVTHDQQIAQASDVIVRISKGAISIEPTKQPRASQG